MEFIEALGAINLGWLIAILLILTVLAVWVALRYEAAGVVGLTGVVALPISLAAWDSNWWASSITAVAVVALFVVGMFISKKFDDYFHGAALLCSVLMPGFLLALFVRTPVWIPTLIATVVVTAFYFYKKLKAPGDAAPANS